MGLAIMIGNSIVSMHVGGGGITITNNLLLEDGFNCLLETGDFILLET